MIKAQLLLLGSQFIFSLCFVTQLWAGERWLPGRLYPMGEVVTQNNVRYVATFWNRGNAPQDSRSHWDGWVEVDDSIALFELGRDYNSGDVVDLYGEWYLAKWGNRNEQPESSWYWRRLGSDDFIDVLGALPVETEERKSALAILGEDRNRNRVRDSYEAKVFALYSNPEQQRLAMNVSYIYQALYELELDESINLLEEEATELFRVLTAWNNCIEVFRSADPDTPTPFELHINTLQRALFYRFGQNEAYRDLNGKEDWIWIPQQRNYCQYYELRTN